MTLNTCFQPFYCCMSLVGTISILRDGKEVASVLTIQAMYAVLRLMRDECVAPPTF